MAILEGFFEAHNRTRLFYRFQPGSTEGNLLLMLHGHGEHSGRYLKFFSILQDLQRPLAIFDLRGCGQSEGLPVYVSEFEDYLRDVTAFVHFLRVRYGVMGPIHLFGNSLGGLIATAWAFENPKEISKLILSSPLFGIPLGRSLRLLVRLAHRVAPAFVVKNPVHPPFLTHDPVEVEKYRKDPLIRRRITIRLVHEMLKYISFFQRKEISLPCFVYILMAEQDFVVDPNATRQFFRGLKAPAKELHSFPGFFHEIFNERGQEKAFERLRDCLTR